MPSKEETTRLLKKAFDGVRRDKKKHELLTPMLYVDSHNTQHSVEYMVPLPIDVPIRHQRNNRNNYNNGYETIWFAAALVSRERNHAQLMSILSADMAYSNARLIGSVKTPWLQKLAPLYHKVCKNDIIHPFVHSFLYFVYVQSFLFIKMTLLTQFRKLYFSGFL